ncbi:ABC transporter ATP-binding protein [Bremerella cremea]|uniref:ABC transporter ATP-binding protein n=1 Tax=Bremerella cremea TaxID=1031537 RepID=UPI0013142EA3|nr:ATP-binding cassette domain-containing protein [Bremerella cremea]
MSVERISLVNAGRVFSGKWALRGIEATLKPGQVYAVLGANGAGKSTLLRLMAGWLPLSEGRILFDQSPMRPTATHLRRKVMLLEEHTVSRNGARSKPTETLCSTINDYQADRPNLEQDIADWYERLEVTSVYNKDERSMSKGQAYKIKLIGLFVVAPPVWLLDEPFSAGLDADGLKVLEEQMLAHARRGGIVAFTSQWPEHARRLANWTVVLDDGRLAWCAPPQEAPSKEARANGASSLEAVLQGLGPQ